MPGALTTAAAVDVGDRSATARVETALLEAKHRPPRIRPGHVSRPRLVQRLLGFSCAPLALLVAPAGYGKTPLLAEWEGPGCPAVRVALAERPRQRSGPSARVDRSCAARHRARGAGRRRQPGGSFPRHCRRRSAVLVAFARTSASSLRSRSGRRAPPPRTRVAERALRCPRVSACGLADRGGLAPGSRAVDRAPARTSHGRGAPRARPGHASR